MADEKDKLELVTVDIDDDSLPEGPEESLNPLADAFDTPAPPPPGNYQVKLFLGRDGIKGVKNARNAGDNFYTCTVEGRIQDSNWENRTVFIRFVDTRVRAGQETSMMATIIAKAGFGKAIKPKMTARDQARLFKKMLVTKEPVLAMDLDWRAWSSNDSKVLANSYAGFPLKDGSKSEHRHWIVDSKGSKCYAALEVVRIYAKGEQPAKAAKAETPSKPTVSKDDLENEIGDLTE